jgi:hypothetical protein
VLGAGQRIRACWVGSALGLCRPVVATSPTTALDPNCEHGMPALVGRDECDDLASPGCAVGEQVPVSLVAWPSGQLTPVGGGVFNPTGLHVLPQIARIIAVHVDSVDPGTDCLLGAACMTIAARFDYVN